MAAIRIGTSGFSYKDWVGPVYPEGLKKADWLRFYSHELGFRACELNFTYYRLPDPRTLERMADKVPEGFLFTVKATRTLTHQREQATRQELARFLEGVHPLLARQKLGCVLAQFPYSFPATPQNRDFLRWMRDGFGELPLVVEFRNSRWLVEESFALLQELGLGFCCVDEPRLRGLIPPIARATSSQVAYVRFHGRNAEKWWKHDEAWERYDYSYSDEELHEWVPKINNLAKEADMVYCFTNNHWEGQAVSAARQLGLLLGQEGA
ncbi:MAG TPA: DUF72 domain-containing protein [Anaerolineae bacterium]|nr:DUF72 domain-containing protein [Anaerolineae bacterium]